MFDFFQSEPLFPVAAMTLFSNNFLRAILINVTTKNCGTEWNPMSSSPITYYTTKLSFLTYLRKNRYRSNFSPFKTKFTFNTMYLISLMKLSLFQLVL